MIVAVLFVCAAILFAVHVIIATEPVSLPTVLTGVAVLALFGVMLHTVYAEYKRDTQEH